MYYRGSGFAPTVCIIAHVHCQTPKWALDGKEVAIELFSPKQDAREIAIAQINDRSHDRIIEGRGGGAAASLLGGKKPPVVELARAGQKSAQ